MLVDDIRGSPVFGSSSGVGTKCTKVQPSKRPSRCKSLFPTVQLWYLNGFDECNGQQCLDPLISVSTSELDLPNLFLGEHLEEETHPISAISQSDYYLAPHLHGPNKAMANFS